MPQQGDFDSPPPVDGDLDAARQKIARQEDKEEPDLLDESTARVVARAATSTVYENADGTKTARLYDRPVNWLDPATKQWKPIDPTFKKDGDGFAATSAPIQVRAGADVSRPGAVSVAGDGWKLAFSLAGSASVAPSAAENEVRYEGVLPGVDLVEESFADRLEETLVLRELPTTKPEYTFPLQLGDLTPEIRADGTIAFVDPAKTVVAVVPRARMWDQKLKQVPVGGYDEPKVDLDVVKSENGWSMTIRPDGEWLRDPARVYPVEIDPTIYPGLTYDQNDVFVSSAAPTTNYQWDWASGSKAIRAGYIFFGTTIEYDSYIKYDLGPIGVGTQIISANWRAPIIEKNASTFSVWALSDAWQSGGATPVTFNNRPNHRPNPLTATVASDNWVTLPMTDWVQQWANATNGGWENDGISLDTSGVQSKLFAIGADENGGLVQNYLEVNYQNLPTPSVPQQPLADAVVMDDTPQFTSSVSTDPEGDAVKYWYRIATNPDGASGQVVNSGWINSPSWTPPSHTLSDGGTYYWRVYTWDGFYFGVRDMGGPSRKLRIDLRLGQQSVSPMDGLGPIGVNMANGNATMTVTGKSLATVGGPVGLSYSYNSQAQDQFGLTGQYYDQYSWQHGSPPLMTRADPVVNFNWPDGVSPLSPLIPDDNFYVRWTGWITVPFAVGYWYFSAFVDDGVRIWIDNTLVVDNWVDHPYGQVTGSPISLQANQSVAIKIEYYDHTGAGRINLQVGGPVNGEVPAQWLTRTPQVLPQGWHLSVAGATPLLYDSANVSDAANSIILNGPTGNKYPYFSAGDPLSYHGQAGGSAVISWVDMSQFWVHAIDGKNYLFDWQGRLKKVRSTTDDAGPASIGFTWGGSAGRLQSLDDVVSSRSINLAYTSDPTGGGSDCSTPPNGFDPLDELNTGLLCRVTYWDGTATNIYYKQGLLARIVDPGSSITDFGYDTGILNQVRAPLSSDAVAQGLTDDDNANYVIGYQGGKVTSITAPKALPTDTVRPQKTYTYVSGTETKMNITGKTTAAGYSRDVTFDTNPSAANKTGRTLTDRIATGQVVTYAWDAGKDQLLSTTTTGSSNAQLKSTTIYDDMDRAVQSYGPVPPSWLGGNGLPVSGHISDTPATTTAYDEGMPGLAVAYWNGLDFVTTPTAGIVAHTLGVGTIDGSVNKNWGTASPVPGVVNTDNWSARLTGAVYIPTSASNWQFQLVHDDGARLYIDDEEQIDAWNTNSTDATNNVDLTAGWHRIRIDYEEKTGGAQLVLKRRQGGAATFTAVPGNELTPRYDLVTSEETKIDASTTRRVTTQYDDPTIGLPTASSVDPSGLNLRTRTHYETSLFRPDWTQLPSGAASQITRTFYGPAETRTVPSDCGTGTVNQAGLLKRTTGADPAGAQGSVQYEQVYDKAGRVIAQQVVGDGRWSCVQYDARGRVTSTTNQAAQTATYNYGTARIVVANRPDSNGAPRTTTTEVDLLGRMIAYTDEYNTKTTYTYNRAGELTRVSRGLFGATPTTLIDYTYEDASRVQTLKEYVSGTGRTTTYTYDEFGRLASAARPDNITTNWSYESDHGSLHVITHGTASTQLWNRTYNRDLAGDVTQEVEVAPGWVWVDYRNYTYDGAGRLTHVNDQHATSGGTTNTDRYYAFDANSNRCKSGAVAVTCSAPTLTYDNADRVQSSPGFSGYGYDSHGNLQQATASAGGTSISITYDANDQAKTITEGSKVVSETMATPGRVYQRTVMQNGSTTENLKYGYAGPSDNPAYTQPVTGGNVTTYITGPEGLHAFYNGTTATYAFADARGSVVGTADIAGTFTRTGTLAGPTGNHEADEFGNQSPSPSNRLGWHGADQRYQEGAGNLVRMGARLYNPGTGRFTSVDPVESANANDYVYPSDPINGSDLTGRIPCDDPRWCGRGHPVHVCWCLPSSPPPATPPPPPPAHKCPPGSSAWCVDFGSSITSSYYSTGGGGSAGQAYAVENDITDPSGSIHGAGRPSRTAYSWSRLVIGVARVVADGGACLVGGDAGAIVGTGVAGVPVGTGAGWVGGCTTSIVFVEHGAGTFGGH